MPTPTERLPSRIGLYRPVAKIGEGGMGTVYRAVHLTSGREVALKVVLAGLADAADAERRFEREARILKGLRHPNVVSLFDVGIADGQRYFAMELLQGESLVGAVGRPWTETLPLLVQACLGLEYLSSRAIVHRDLSPSNLFVIEDGEGRRVKILDFGIAKDLAGTGTLDNFTRTGVLMGKPAYWSPEQLGSLGKGLRIDWRSDVYSLGVVFHYVLSGQLPFTAETPYDFANAHLFAAPAPFVAPQGNPPFPEELAGLVGRMLAKRREERPQSYREIIDVLWRLLPPEAARALEPLPPPPVAPEGSGEMPAPDVSGTWGGEPTRTEPSGEATLTLPPAAPTERPRPRRSPLPAVLAASALVVLGGATLLLLRARRALPPAASPAPAVAAPAASPAPQAGGPYLGGKLILQALPWARVVSIREETTGREVPLGSDVTTPAILALPAGRYKVELVNGAGEGRRVETVTVTEAGVSEQVVRFETPRDAAAHLQ